MAYTIVNLTLKLLEREIEDFLWDYPPNHPYRMVCSVPYLHNKLVATVLSRVPNRYCVVEETNFSVGEVGFYQSLLEERILIEDRIRAAIPELVQKEGLMAAKLGEIEVDSPHAWWLKIHTATPCVTYHFGPFASHEEAKLNYWGYLEDLLREQAEGISFEVRQGQPTVLTQEGNQDWSETVASFSASPTSRFTPASPVMSESAGVGLRP